MLVAFASNDRFLFKDSDANLIVIIIEDNLFINKPSHGCPQMTCNEVSLRKLVHIFETLLLSHVIIEEQLPPYDLHHELNIICLDDVVHSGMSKVLS